MGVQAAGRGSGTEGMAHKLRAQGLQPGGAAQPRLKRARCCFRVDDEDHSPIIFKMRL